ncbi:hypothetical protein CBL_13918 [Carabus blaptoides fortunei]
MAVGLPLSTGDSRESQSHCPSWVGGALQERCDVAHTHLLEENEVEPCVGKRGRAVLPRQLVTDSDCGIACSTQRRPRRVDTDGRTSATPLYQLIIARKPHLVTVGQFVLHKRRNTVATYRITNGDGESGSFACEWRTKRKSVFSVSLALIWVMDGSATVGVVAVSRITYQREARQVGPGATGGISTSDGRAMQYGVVEDRGWRLRSNWYRCRHWFYSPHVSRLRDSIIPIAVALLRAVSVAPELWSRRSGIDKYPVSGISYRPQFQLLFLICTKGVEKEAELC